MIELIDIFALFAFLLGASIASFLNVVVWRVPRGESIVSPPSHCPKCSSPIKWRQNLPIISWLVLRGKCANCKAPISPRYIAVELIGGVLFLATFWRYGIYAPLAWVWISLMIVGSFIDFDHQVIPDFVTVGGMILGVGYSLLFYFLPLAPDSVFSMLPRVLKDLRYISDFHAIAISPLYSLIGLAFGFGLLWLVRFLGTKAFKREAMGMGDVFLLGAVGAISGPVAVLVVLVASSVFGSVVGISMIILNKAKLGKFTAIPYGPYIFMGSVFWMFWGPDFVNWYLRLIIPR